jgi:DnaJ-class molecular chaperone
MSTSAGVTDQLFVRDGWCIACDGMGIQKCLNKNCRNGVIVGREDMQVATDLRGKPIYGKSVTRDTCPTCDGRGGEPCRHCNGGKL